MANSMKQYIKEMKDIQERHIAILGDPALINVPLDMNTMLFERKRAFENLRNSISMTPASSRNPFRNDINNILEKNEQLTLIIDKKKQELSAMLSRNAKGKKVLNGYRHGNPKASRFMNTSG
ncbi:conserved hypothetical protein [Desulfamplus magnetovallimortis]|uniref:FlgN family protein n=1 Tax=Desulfamplus magnetovallimortis TaxID=1246637 RepID=A0A1W1H9P6_9BACT|nr:flagellar protein FliT [Desulfamplus magnetovallimortis]SLM29207.1 conserved hypothetical protein [Desulfamplus magnetovallimortis]